MLVHIPLILGAFPLQLHMIPLSLEEEECEDEGIGGGGGDWIRAVSSYQRQGRLCERKKKKKTSPCCAHVPLFCIISERFEAFMVLIPSIFSGLIY